MLELTFEEAREIAKVAGAPVFDQMPPMHQAQATIGVMTTVLALQHAGYRIVPPLKEAENATDS